MSTKSNTPTQPNAVNAPGSLDPTFGVDGASTIPDPANPDLTLKITGSATDATADADQRIYLSCTSTRKSYFVRLLKDGAIDKSFGNAGYADLPLADPTTHELVINSFIFMDSGKIIGWGAINVIPFPIYSVPVAVCVTADGVVDTSFGDNGIAIFKLFMPKSPTANEPDLQKSELRQAQLLNMTEAQEGMTTRTTRATQLADGKLLLQGKTVASYDHIASYLIRIKTDGSLDTDFGEDGVLLIKDPSHSTLPECEHFDIDRRGGIVVTGTHYRTRLPVLLARYDSEGHVDRSFGENGVVHITNPNGTACHARGIKTLDDGRVIFVAAFFDVEAVFQYPAVIKLLSNGSPDPHFNNGEPALIDPPPTGSSLLVLTLSMDDGNRIIIGGTLDAGSEGYLSRILPDGRLDAGFGSNGTAVFKRIRWVRATSIQSRVNIIASGDLVNGGVHGLIRITG